MFGLLNAQRAGVKYDAYGMNSATRWLEDYQQQRFDSNKPISNVDAAVARTLALAKSSHDGMLERLFEQRASLSPYGIALLGIALATRGKHEEQVQMLLRNLSQFRRDDDERQIAYLDLPASGWLWHDDRIETHATYLKLLVKTSPQAPETAALAKYLICNRRNATYWNNTRDTALCVDALADFVVASGEAAAELEVEVLLDGEAIGQIELNPENFFDPDLTRTIGADRLPPGDHQLELRKRGEGPLYFTSRLSSFALGDSVRAQDCPELSIRRGYFLTTAVEKKQHSRGARGQALEESVELRERTPLESGQAVRSGDIIEIELSIESGNAFEYLLIADPKFAGCEPLETLSGYGDFGGMFAYRELRDQQVAFFVRSLERGEFSLSYRLRAETPGTFRALPAVIEGMYAVDLRANSEPFSLEIKA